jgi:hypothetical protein
MGFAEEDVLWVTKAHGTKKINEALNKWHEEDPKKHRPRFICATTSIFGYGHTMSEALITCLLEPDYRLAVELQYFGRNDRLGQRNPYSLNILLFNPDDERECGIRERNSMQKNIVTGQIYDTDEVIHISDDDNEEIIDDDEDEA